MAATSRRPYLIRAIHEWALDNGLTPHIVVSADADGVTVPRQYVQDGKITLNIGQQAARGLQIGDDGIRFSARFAGQPWQVSIPVGAVLAIYARESGEGIVFSEIESGDTPPSTPPPAAPPKRGKPQLKVVK
jgi:stringent starvation protein B